MRWPIVYVVMLSIPVGSTFARACPLAVRLGGDGAVVAEVAPLLRARGISSFPGECPALAVTLEKRGRATLVLPVGEPEGAREVTDARTAATVIESWVRTDVEEPLLARRHVEEEPLLALRLVQDGPARDDEVPAVLAAATARPPRPLEIVALAESGLATDHTTWVGFAAGGCSSFGPACVGALGRIATVADGPGEWEAELDRDAVDALATVDLPLRIGAFTMASGLGLGLGWVHTHEERTTDAKQTVGLRAETHLALSYPMSKRLAIEAALAFDVAQTSYTRAAKAKESLPADPRLLAHAGVGLRFGGL